MIGVNVTSNEKTSLTQKNFSSHGKTARRNSKDYSAFFPISPMLPLRQRHFKKIGQMIQRHQKDRDGGATGTEGEKTSRWEIPPFRAALTRSSHAGPIRTARSSPQRTSNAFYKARPVV